MGLGDRVKRLEVTLLLTAVASLVLSSETARAREYRLGVILGAGSASITVQPVSVSQGPLQAGLLAESPVADALAVSLEHRRSLKLSPLSSDISFTNAILRWYPWGQAWPRENPETEDVSENTWNQNRFAVYLGGGPGLASGGVTQKLSTGSAYISGSALSLSLQAGVDYTWGTRIVRVGLDHESSLSGASLSATSVSACLMWRIGPGNAGL